METKQLTKDPRSKYLSEIKSALKEADHLVRRAGVLQASIYTNVYSWVRHTVDTGDAESNQEAFQRLARSIKRSKHQIQTWYNCGMFMADYRLNPSKVEARSVRAIAVVRRSLPKHRLLRAVQMAKDNAPPQKIEHFVRSTANVVERSAERRSALMKAKGILNKTAVSMQALVLATMAKRFYGHDVTVVVQGPNGGKLIEAEGHVDEYAEHTER